MDKGIDPTTGKPLPTHEEVIHALDTLKHSVSRKHVADNTREEPFDPVLHSNLWSIVKNVSRYADSESENQAIGELKQLIQSEITKATELKDAQIKFLEGRLKMKQNELVKTREGAKASTAKAQEQLLDEYGHDLKVIARETTIEAANSYALKRLEEIDRKYPWKS